MRQSEARLEGSSRGPSASAWGVPLTSPSLVTHQGKLIAFARAARVDPATAAPTESLFFKVFEPQQAMNAADERAWYGWFQFDFPEAPPRDAVDARAKKEGPPAELRLAGMDLLTVTRDAAAVRPADASFQIVSDDTYLYCFRPSVHGTLYLNRLMLLDASPAYALEVAWEVRYQRSGLRDVPDGETDTQSYTDPAGRPFLEPTIELSQVRDIEGGAFAVARVPVGSDGAAAWYVAAQGGLALHRIDQTSGSVVDLTEAKAYQRLAPTLRSTSTKLTPIAGRAPALAFYTEHDEGKTSSAEQIELQRCGRLMLAIPVFAGGLDPATAIYDFALDLTGRIAELKTAEQQSLVVADGTFENGTFHPADGPSYPTADKAAATVQMVDGLAVDSMLLGQVRPTTDLALRLGEDGRVHLYYGGSPPSAAEIVRIGWSSLTPGAPQAMVARYDPRVSRVQIDVPWIPSQLEQQNPGSVHFVAAQSGSIMGGAKVSIAESACGSDLCDVIVEYPEATKLPAETWHAVPREVSAFAEVLNGGASDDSTDPDVLAGTQAFFDFEGRLPMVRVPVAPNHAGEAAAIETHQPVVTFVSTRAELPLTEVEVGPGRRVVLRFAGMDGAPIEQVWGDLPPSVAAYASIFGGDADAAVYGYERGDGTTPVFALPTDAYGIPAPLVLYATDPGQGVSDLKITVTAPVKVQPTDPELVLHFDRAGERLFSVPATSRAVAVVVDALGKSDHVRALGLVVSAEGVAGNLVADSVAQEADLRDGAALFDLIVTPRAAEHDELEQGRREAFTTSHGFPVGAPEHDLTRLVGFAVSFDRPEIGTAYVATGAGDAEQSVNRRLAGRADASAPQGGSWQRVPPAKACSFDGRNAMTVPVAGRPRSEDLRPQRTWTMESWLLPRGGGDQRVVTFRDAETAVPARAPRLDYRLSLASRRSARFEHGEPGVFYQSAFKANGREETDHRFLNVPEFTYDFWVRPDPVPCPADAPERLGGIVTVAFAWDHKPYFAIGLDRERHVVVRVTEHDVDRDLRSQGPLLLPPDGTADWHHVAVTARQHATTQRWTFELYVDGALDSSMSDVPMQLVLPPEQLPPSLYIGRLRPHDSSVWGDVANLRYWGTARKVDEIRRTAPVALSGSEDGLLGYWPLDDEGTRQKLNVATATKGLWTAMYETHATETEVPQPAAVVADNPFVDAVAAVGGLSAVKASCGLLSGRWNHLAVRFEAGGALDLNPDARLRLGELDWMRVRGDDFTPSTAFAVDAWVSIPKRMPTAGTILSRWAWNDARKQSYKLEVTAAGELELAVALLGDPPGPPAIARLSTQKANLADGKVHHVAAVFSGTTAKLEKEKGKYTLSLYVDGTLVATRAGEAPGAAVQIASSDADVLVGRGNAAPDGVRQVVEDLALFRGVLGRLRFWNAAPTVEDLFPERNKARPELRVPPGLTAEWDFRDQGDKIAADSVGGNDGVLTSSAPWSGLPEVSALTIFANGQEVRDVGPVHDEPAAMTQFTVGARAEGGTGLVGELARLELWGEARSTEEMSDQRFVPRVGDEDGLLACWDFSAGGKDITGGGNDADPAIEESRIRPSAVPVTDDGPFVRNAYGGVLTTLTRSAPNRIAVGSYADVQRGGTAEQRAVLKRQHLLDPAQALPGPIQIGILDLVYVGQVQTRPTLVGYIEGAPPVPSENLSRPYWSDPASSDYSAYDGVSDVALVQQGDRQVAYSSNTVTAGELSVDAALGVAFDTTFSVHIPFVADVTQFKTEGNLMLAVSHSSKWGRDDDEGLSASWTTEQRDVMAAGGDWEAGTKPEDYLNQEVGRRYVPDNLAYALVESLTADLYAAVCRSTGAAVTTILLPNLAIPPDRNVLMFPMDGKYTKAGTLDGKVGLSNDPDYGDADVRRGSYFRPQEAYALAAAIDQENARSQAYAEQFDWERRGKGARSGLADVKVNPAPKTGIVNRYAWSADGGLHVEQQGYASMASRSHTGFYEMATGGGLRSEGKIVAPVGLAWALDVMALASVDVHVGLTDESSKSIGLEVTTDVESYLRGWDPGDAERPAAFRSGSAAGKVRAYRFMSFFLPPSVDNASALKSVVDPTWRQHSSDPDARAMRAIIAARNPVWRVLHRVTYVERVPPPIASRPAVVAASPLREPVNPEGSVELLRLIDGALDHRAPVTPAAVGAAVAVVLNPAPAGDGTYPQSLLETQVPWWRTFLDAARRDPTHESGRLLSRLVVEVVDYVFDGYRTGAIGRLLKPDASADGGGDSEPPAASEAARGSAGRRFKRGAAVPAR